MNSVKITSQDPSLDGENKNLASISPFFIVKDLETSISHYIDRFGFQLDFQGPAANPYYGRVSRDGIGIMLKAVHPEVLPQPNSSRHPWARWDAYIYSADPAPYSSNFRSAAPRL